MDLSLDWGLGHLLAYRWVVRLGLELVLEKGLVWVPWKG